MNKNGLSTGKRNGSCSKSLGMNHSKNHLKPTDDFHPNEDVPADFVDDILDNDWIQYNICRMLESEVLPQIYLMHKWNWWLVYVAMIKLGFFRTHFNRLQDIDDIPDINFARCMYCFLPAQFIFDNIRGETTYTKSGLPYNNIIRNICKNIYDHRKSTIEHTIDERYIQDIMLVLCSYELTFL